MSLTIGSRLGPYEILVAIGAGGMGEVYRARDSKLGRDVALKVLLPSVADDPDRLTRFRREAQVLASLNHPNIAQIHGFEDSGATHALVMELVEGATLAELVGGLPLAQTLAIVRQIADALSAAHEQGIIHRDLKPANVKVRDDGTVKVLDFGLAKAMSADIGNSSAAAMNSPTLTGRATQLGMIIGTAAYMAPEQAKGRAVDRRADIWAFGVVLFEMLSGRRAFDGDDVSEILASVLKTDPDWNALPPDTPPAVRRLLRRCLERDPKRRLRDIAEGMFQLEEGLAEPPAPAAVVPVVAPAPPRPLWRRALPVGVAVAVTAGIMTVASVLLRRPAAPAEIVRFEYAPMAANPLRLGSTYPDLAVSHDGRTIVYATGAGGISTSQLFVHAIDRLDAAALRGAEAGVAPFFSPDDAWVGFVDQATGSQIKKVSAFGGPPVLVCTTKSQIYGATWAADGSIIIGSPSGLYRCPDGGGDPVQVTNPEAATGGDTSQVWPSAIPGSPAVLLTTGRAAQAQLSVLDRPGGRVIPLKIAGTAPRYLPSGHLAYAASDGSLRVVPFDLGRLAITGNPVPVDVSVSVKSTGAADFDVARDGRLVYAGGSGIVGDRTLTWVDRTGHETPIAAPPRSYVYARVSPDGTRLSLDIRNDKAAIWIWDMRGTLTRLTSKAGSDQYGLWNPDGERVIGASVIGQKNGLFQSRANATGDPELILEKESVYPNAVTPDGKTLIFRAFDNNAKNDLYAVPLVGDHVAKPLLATEHDELNAAISPDGKWLAYQSDLSGRTEVYVRPFPDVNANQWPISTNGGTKPAWAPTGHELFYLAGDSLMSVPVTVGPPRGFAAGVPAPLFPISAYFFGGVGRNYDISPDSKRFVMVKNAAAAATGSTPITVVLNWLVDVKARTAKN